MMSTMMQTQNPEAHARLVDPVVLPGVGAIVVYHMRPHEMRAGKTAVPAMVMKVDRDNMLLDLLLFYDHLDQMMIQAVPPRIGTDRGWALQEGDTAALEREVEALRAENVKLWTEIEAAKLRDEAFRTELATMLLGEDGEKPSISFQDQVVSLASGLADLREVVMGSPAPAAAQKARKAKGKTKAKSKG